MSLFPDPTFYPSPGLAMQAAPEGIAYVALLNVGTNGKRDAMGVIDVDPGSSAYGQLDFQVDFPGGDNELNHFGLERLQRVSLPAGPASAHGTSLPGGAGYRLVAGPYPGYESGPQTSQNSEGDRA